MNVNFHFKTIIVLCLVITQAKSQTSLSGSYSVPGTYTSIGAVINGLNTFGVSGPVTINVSAGHTETTPSGGYTLTNVAGSSSLNTITFQKSGIGANPLITGFTGTATPSSATQDGIWRFLGSDYVTIDGIDLLDPNTTNPATMEFGYGFQKAGVADGCQNNTIKNCVISLSRENNATGTLPSENGSRGIDMVNSTSSAHTTNLTITSASGANSNNKFYSNTVQNCNIGISLIGYVAPSPFTFADFGNDIGGSSSLTGNILINYGGGAAATNQAMAVRTQAQYNLNVSYNTINNNTGSGVNHVTAFRGIYVGPAISANVTINSNTVSIKNGATASQVTAIENAGGATAANNTVTINNNLITGCTNSVNISGITLGIWNQASAAYLQMTGNTFTNNTTNSTTGSNYLMYNSGAVNGNINISNNNLSLAYTNPTLANSGIFYQIFNGSGTTTTTLSITNNNFSNITNNITATGTWYCINQTSSVRVSNISNNAFINLSLNHSGTEYLINNSGSTQLALSVTNNSIVTGFTRMAAATGIMYCYFAGGSSLGSSTQLFTGNNFSNISANIAGTGGFYGIYTSDGAASPYPLKTIYNNLISNVNYAGTGTSYGYFLNYLGDGSTSSVTAVYNNTVSNVNFGGGSAYGMYIASLSSPNYRPNVYQNEISAITTTNAASINYGLYVNANTVIGANIYKNKVHTINSNGATGAAYGLYVSTGANTYIYNNLIGNINTPNSSGLAAANGIYVGGGTSLHFVNNTVYLNATSSALTFGSNGFYASTTPTLNMQNNVIVNNSIANGTGITAAYRRSSTTLTSYSASANNNLFYAGVPSATNVIFHDGTTAYQTLSTYKTLVASRDANSVTENPPFASTTGSSVNYLNINPAIATQVESGGSPFPGITDDYSGTIRNIAFPDIGAWEGSYTPSGSDLNAPSILSAGFVSSACNTTSRTYTVGLADFSGVGSGTATPRVYYRVNAGAYSSVPGVLVAGSSTLGVWSFTLSYSAVVTDVISHYLLAQDIATTPNLVASPGAGFVGTDVNTVTTPPTTPSTYTIYNSLAGSYTVGASGTYTSLTAAANAYNSSCLNGAVTFVLSDATYSTETFPITFSNNIDASSTNSLLIQPAASVSVVINCTNTAAAAIIKLHNARYITIDGLNTGGSALTFTTASTGTSADIWLASASTIGCKYISIKNTNIRGGSNTVTGSYGILAALDGATPVTTAGNDNDFVTIQGNTFERLYHGIYGSGPSAASAGGLDNWTISGNLIGPTSNGTTNLGGNGVFMSGAINLNVTANTIQNFSMTATALNGVRLNSNINGYTISQNTISSMYSSASASGISSHSGIFLGAAAINGTVSFNQITRIENTSTGGWGARGMIVATANAASNVKIFNNMISDIVTYSDASIIYAPVGIEILNSSGGIDCDFNTISLFGAHPSLTSGCFSAAMSITSANTNLKIRNNILSNTYDNSSTTTDIEYGIYSSVANTNYSAIDNNDYYVASGSVSTFTSYVGYQLANYSTLAGLATAMGQNINSKNLLAVFTATNNLHLDAANTSNFLIDNLGASVSGITTDIDAQSRNVSTPDMGADEFTSTAVCASANGGSISSSSFTQCSNQALSLTSASVSAGLGTAYQWQVSPTSGGTYTNVASGTGTNTPSFSTPSLAAGVYYYVLRATCGSSTAVSNEATVTVNALPNPIIVASNSIVCSGNSATLTASGANTYTWNTGAIGNSIVITPTASGIYNVIGGNTGCTDVTSGNNSIFFNLNPTVTATSATSVVCSGVPATLTASGANSYTWDYGATGALVNPTPSVNTTYTVIGAFTNGCNSSATVSMAVNPSPTIGITGSSGICTGQTATLIASGAVSYSWNTGSTSATITATPVSNTTYTVIGTDALGCSTTTTQLVTVAGSLSITITGPSAICTGSTTILTGNGGVTYLWNTGASTPTISVNPTVTTTYSVIGSSGTCSNTASKNLTVNPNPTVSVSGNLTICSGQSTTLTVSGASSYTWNTGSNLTSIVVSPTVNSNYTVTGTSTLGCTGNAVTSVVSNTLPIITVSQSSAAICAFSSATLSASGANTYTWNTGSNNASISVTPSVTSIYTVTGTNGFGCIRTTTTSITAFPLPVITIAPPAATVCVASPVTFSANGASTYTWNGSVASVSITLNPTVSSTYSVFGTSSLGCVNSATVGVLTNSLPIIAIAPASTTVCSLSMASFTASGASTYTWNSTVVGATFNNAPAINTTYTVVGTDALGCNSSQTVAAITLSLPVIVITPSIATVCSMSTATFAATGAQSYTWSNATNGSTVALTPTIASAYSVNGTDVNGCVASTPLVILTNPLPTLTVTPASSTVCPNVPLILNASGATTYSWNSGGSGSTTTVIPLANTVYTVDGIDGNGCVGTGTSTVVTKLAPVISIAPSSASVCLFASANFSASGAVSFTWSNGVILDNITVSPTVSTSYSVSGTNTLGCKSTSTVGLTIWQPPVVNVTSSSQTVCARETITLTASGAATYTWFPFNATGSTFTNSPVNTTQYIVSGNDDNGCNATNTITVFVNKCTGINTLASTKTEIRLYPNPNNGSFTVEFVNGLNKTIEVMDVTGRLILSTESLNDTVNINLNAFANGVYYVKVQSENTLEVIKVIKQ